jgi:hypothetical protein
MKLDDTQTRQVAGWIEQGLSLSTIQDRLASEFGLRLTYLDLRLLLGDLQLKPKDQESSPSTSAVLPGQPKPAQTPTPARAAEPFEAEADLEGEALDEPAPAGGPGGVTVSIDQLTRPGALASGKVTFSDGKTADWFLDQMGRLGLVPKDKGHRPSQQDVLAFQAELQNELARLGM